MQTGTGITLVGFVTVLTLSFGSGCPGKESEARTSCKTTGNDFATDSATNSPWSGCVYLRFLPYGLGQTTTKRRPKDTEGGH